jgi:formylglycine-generating enzyme required for sulfatase activity/GTPase SAR1 family protein
MKDVKIFISYAHDDDAYFRVFKKGIESHSKSSKNLKWKIWADKKISVGALWHDEIQKEIKECDAAILLVSAHFLSSDYIENQEFLKFLEKTEEEGFIFLPILLSDCDFTQWEKLSERQFFYPQGKDYNLRELSNITYSHLVEFYKGEVVPNSYRETYHKKCVEAFEKAIQAKQKISANNNINILSTNSQSNKDLLKTYKKRILKYSKVRLLDKDVNVNDIYVDLLFEPFHSSKKDIRSCDELICKEPIENEDGRKNFINMVILGLPGAGKTTLLKYLLYKYNQEEDIIPIYVELKKDNDFKTHIIEYSEQVRIANIHEYLKSYFEPIFAQEEAAKAFLDFVSKEEKELIFFCDGLDEISTGEYDKFKKAIKRICSFNKHRVIISSREVGFSVNDYSDFRLYSLKDFDTDKQIKFINNYFNTVDKESANRKDTLIDLINTPIISKLAKNPILLYLLCITDDPEIIRNKVQLFDSAIRILLKKFEDKEARDRLIIFLKYIAVDFYKLDNPECFEKNELDFYAKKFFCQKPDETCDLLLKRYLECGLFVPDDKEQTYKFIHRTIWEYLVASGMLGREESEIYSRANMGLWEEPIKMYVTLLNETDANKALTGIWKENKSLALSCMREFERFPEKTFTSLYEYLDKRGKLMLIATLRENYIKTSHENQQKITNIIKDTLESIHDEETKAKDCEVIYAYIEFLEEFRQESVFDKLLTKFLDLNNASYRRQQLCTDFGLSFAEIPSGNFEMGRNLMPETETDKEDKNLLNIDLEETPAHQVKISHSFKISQTLITNEMYYKSGFPYADKERFEKNNPWSNQDTQPVNKVNWYEAIIFAKWLGCTLPTEAEWEYSFIGNPDDRLNFTKSYKDEMRAILDENEFACYSKNSNNTTRLVLPIKGTRTNSFGLLDMLGNLREWCMDWYSDDFYTCCTVKNFKNFTTDIIGQEKISYKSDGDILKEGAPPYNGDVFTFDKNGNCINPVKRKPGKFEAKCLRGGCYDWNESNLRPTYRNHNPANNVYKVNGFRLVLKDEENIQSELSHKMIDEKILNENINRGIDEYTHNSAIINFNNDNNKYHFSIEKHFTLKTDVIPPFYSFLIFANKFLDIDSKQSVDFYRRNPLCWNALDVQVSIRYQNIGDNDFSNTINNIKLTHNNKSDNVIQFDVYYETNDGQKIPIKKGAKIQLKYSYCIPINLWGNYMNRYVSSNEPMFIKLRYDGKNQLSCEIEEVLSDGTREKMKGGYDCEKENGYISLEIRKNNPLAQYRILWNADKYFTMRGLNTFDLNELNI